MYPIATLTFNPCIDKSTRVSALLPEKKLRCSAPIFEPGGGGINVARAIKKLGGNALAIFPAGGYSGKFLNDLLRNENIPAHCIESSHHTRENLIVFDESLKLQYRFGMPGPQLSELEWRQCINAFNVQNSSYKVLSGSWPPGLAPEIVQEIAHHAKRNQKKLIVDTGGETLQLALMEGVFMIKPNLGELSALFKTEVTAYNAGRLAREIVDKKQAEIVVVSLGPEGALLVTGEDSKHFIPPRVETISTVGAGDSMVAGITWKLSAGSSVDEAVRFGVACGTAATMNPGTELCHLNDAEALFDQIGSQTLALG